MAARPPPPPTAAQRAWLIIGGTQFMGRALVTLLLEAERSGEHVTLLNRGKTPTPWLHEHPRLARVKCDRFAERAQFRSLVRGGAWDVIVDFQAFDPPQVDDAQRRAQTPAGGAEALYIFISTDSVYMASPPPSHGGALREGDARLPQSAAERATVALRDDPYQADYGGGKLRCEALLRERGARWVALRMPDVIGAHDNCGGFLDLRECVVDGAARIGTSTLYQGERNPAALRHRVSTVFAPDVARAVLCAADLAAAEITLMEAGAEGRAGDGVLRRCFNVACDETPLFEELCAMVRRAALGADAAEALPPIRFDATRDAPMVTVCTGALDTTAWRAATRGAWHPTPLRDAVRFVAEWYGDPANVTATRDFEAGTASSSSEESSGSE